MVKFHLELPWIISSSDDQTIRIWNWQNRSITAILTGHTHYVMSVQFHNEDNLILSSSLDNKIYVWDYSELKEKHQKYAGDAKGKKIEMFTGVEVEVKNICEGHEKGVNFACFHPTRSLIASGADDKLIKLWRMSGARAWEMDTLRGHTNNVSCVAFHPKLDILISNSEDRTMKVWDLNRRTCIYTMKKEVDRFWVVAMHPTSNYFACGYDRGMSIFKLEKESFHHQRVGNQLFYVKNKVLLIEDLTNMESLPQANLEIDGKQVLMNQPTSVNYNHFDTTNHDILLNYEGDEDFAILVVLNKNLSKNTSVVQRKIESSKGAVFIAKDKMCVLSKSKSLFIYLFDGRNKKIEWSMKNPINNIYQATIGKIIIKSGDDVLLFDIAARKVVCEVQFSNLRKVYWSQNMTYVALFSQNQIMICTKNLKSLCTIKESSKLKTGCFDNENGFIYSTFSHIKYLLVSEKISNEGANNSGIFKALDNPVYVCGFINNSIYSINREGKVLREEVNTAEYELKVALKSKKINEVIRILKKGQLSGNAVIQYLKEEKCADIALLFEKDPKTRFSLALSSGNIKEAFKNASEIKEKDVYLQLADNSLQQGFFNVAEKSYQSIKAFSKLSFFYSNQGCISKLKKMQVISMDLNNKHDVFENSILLGNVRDRVKLLMQTNQIALAYMSAKAHNLEDLIPLIEEEMQNREIKLAGDFSEQLRERSSKAQCLLPCRPIFIENEEFTTSNWPHTMLLQSNVQEKMAEDQSDEQEYHDARDSADDTGRDISDLLTSFKEKDKAENDLDIDITANDKYDDIDALADDSANDKWGDEIELDDDILGDMGADDMAGDPDLADLDNELKGEEQEVFIPPSRSNDPLIQIVANSMIPAHHIAVGNFKEALALLRKQIGLSNPRPLRNIFAFIQTNSKISLPSLPKFPSIPTILRTTDGSKPFGIISLDFLKKIYKEGFNETTKGNFKNALLSFQKCIQHAAVSVASNIEEEKQIKKTVSDCVEYILAMKIELKRRDTSAPQNKNVNNSFLIF
jgi:coatomer subunit alpha